MRIGCMKNGSRDVIEHKWFQKINWCDLVALRIEVGPKKKKQIKLQPPIVPTLFGDGDTGNFDAYEENVEPEAVATQREKDLFAEW